MKLHISKDGPFKGARGVALAPRFPRVTTLKLHAGHSHDGSADNKSFGSLMQGEQWHAVTSLQLSGLSAVAASKAISACHQGVRANRPVGQRLQLWAATAAAAYLQGAS